MMIYNQYKRRMASILFYIVCFTLPMGIHGQNKQFTLDDLIPGGKTYSKFTPRTLKQLQWSGTTYLYAKGDSVLGGKPGKKSKETVLFTRASLNEALVAAGLKTVSGLPAFTVTDHDKTELVFESKQVRVQYDWKAGKVVSFRKVDENWKNCDWTADNKWLAFTEDNNLRVVGPDEKVVEVTADQDKGIVNGQSVHRNEFGISKGTFWSPNGNKLAFYRMDERMVTDYPIVDVTARTAVANPIKYPMAGMKSHEVTVGVYNPSTGKTVFLQTGTPKDKYLTNLAWSPDGQSIYLAEVNREQNVCNLVRYDANTGKREVILFTEEDSAYVEPQNPVLFLPQNSDRFIWQSMRDGYNHLYLYDINGKLVKQLTKGDWIVTDVLGFDASGKNLFYMSTEVSPMERHLYSVNLASGVIKKHTTLEGTHQIKLAPGGEAFIDQFSSQHNPRTIQVTTVASGQSLELLKASNPYKDYAFPEIVTGTIKAADGTTDLYYRLVKPVGMDETKKYPAVVYVYGGPHAQLVNNTWMADARGWDIYMAQMGFVVFTVDSRGSANRGAAFEQVIHRNLGVNEMADQIKGVEFLKSLPYVDGDKLGVHGWSYGGFMTTNLMLSYPDIFKVGVAGGPVIDWQYYEIMYGERYMDTPKENPEGYKNANLKLKAGNLKGHLLLIHGDIDPVVVWQHSLTFLKACVNEGTYPDYFVYPGHEHNVIGKDRPHLSEKITRYFMDYLK